MTAIANFEGFDVSTEIYSVVEGHPIETDILIPKLVPEGHQCPVIVRIHGGFLVRLIPSISPSNTYHDLLIGVGPSRS